ncbi:hypothetical protein SeLEV6574_g07885 [Synchytrium endobioticum]|uniref:Uncharacterized protein n=1 Tax=Synchytrium endobioticum TaxID=286115 RepID=A0A507CDI0_9FUNG|nr:hypothetical protein SeLEV6574_g07885 [Synchytrium endobioticum]
MDGLAGAGAGAGAGPLIAASAGTVAGAVNPELMASNLPRPQNAAILRNAESDASLSSTAGDALLSQSNSHSNLVGHASAPASPPASGLFDSVLRGSLSLKRPARTSIGRHSTSSRPQLTKHHIRIPSTASMAGTPSPNLNNTPAAGTPLTPSATTTLHTGPSIGNVSIKDDVGALPDRALPTTHAPAPTVHPFFKCWPYGRGHAASDDGLTKKKKVISYFHLLYKYADTWTVIYMIIGTIAAMANGAVTPILNLLIGQLANVVTDYENLLPNYTGNLFNELVSRVIVLGALAGVSLVAGFLQTFCWTIQAEKSTKILRERYFASLLRQELAWFDTNPTGELASRISADVNIIYDGTAEKVGFTIQFTTSCIAGLALAFYTSWRLSVILLGVFPIPAICLNRMWNQVGVNLDKVQSAYSKAGALATEALRNIVTVMSNNGQAQIIKSYFRHLDEAFGIAKQIAYINTAGVATVSFFFMAVRTPVFYYGGLLVLEGQLTAGNAISTFLQISSGVMFLGNVMMYLQAVNEAQGAAQKVFEVIGRKPALDITAKDGKVLEDVKGRIEFRNVTFRYPARPEVTVLKSFSLIIEPGQKVALVGQSGSGKSTVFQLLLRMYEFETGEILLDGVDIRCMNLRYLREVLSIVSQEPVLFDTSVRENVELGAKSQEKVMALDIERALAAANALEFVRNLPHGVETVITGGTTLSGGQKQRIAIARAVLRNPKILLLDEATSALDTRSESVVQKALDQLSRDRTTLTIAHRLSTIQDSDVIVVMEDGHAIERGNHEELLRTGGVYASMVAAQASMPALPELPGRMSPGSSPIRTLAPLHIPDSPRSVISTSTTGPNDVKLPTINKDGTLTASETEGEIDQGDDVELKRLEIETSRLGNQPFPLQRLVKISAPHRKFVILGLIGSILDGASVPLEALLMGTNLGVYQNPTLYGGAAGVVKYSLLFLALAGLAFVSKGLQQYGFGISGARLTQVLREMTFAKLVALDMYFFDQPAHRPGVEVARLATDADTVKRVGGPLLGQLLTLVINSGLGLAIAFAYGWQLTLVMLGCAPILFGATYLERRALEGFLDETQKNYAASGNFAALILTNIKTVTMLGRDEYFVAKYAETLIPVYKIGVKKAVAAAAGAGLFQMLLIVTLLVAFFFCYYLIVNQILAFNRITVVILNVLLTSAAAGAMASATRNITDAKVAALAIFETVDTKPRIDIQDQGGRRDKVAGNTTVEIRNVKFSFPSRPTVQVLKGVSLKIEHGKKVAVVGSSGSGKSTLALLVERIYDPDQGSVSFGGTDMKSWNLRVLREQIGVVGQEPVLFDLTIEENIRYGYPEATHADVEDAARAASVHDFILRQPDGYKTRVGEMGGRLSGGQKQRICIARAIVRKPALLILDEATSALDAETETIVDEALHRISSGVTTLVIAHRLRTIQNSDHIYVLQNGEVVEDGTYSNLMGLQGQFYSLVQAQTRLAGVVPEQEQHGV